MYDNKSAVDALSKGLDDLEDLFQTLQDKYEEDFAKGDYAVVEEPELDWDEIRAKAQAVRAVFSQPFFSFGPVLTSRASLFRAFFSPFRTKTLKPEQPPTAGESTPTWAIPPPARPTSHSQASSVQQSQRKTACRYQKRQDGPWVLDISCVFSSAAMAFQLLRMTGRLFARERRVCPTWRSFQSSLEAQSSSTRRCDIESVEAQGLPRECVGHPMQCIVQ